MFNIFKKKKPAGETATFKISGMHCTSCSMNIDGELEDTNGVVSADTSYADAKTKVVFDSKQISQVEIKKVIEGTGYEVVG
jgi:copper chaperone CopZ